MPYGTGAITSHCIYASASCARSALMSFHIPVPPPYQGGRVMKTSIVLFTILAILVLTSAPAAANPAILPKHPGYPMGKAVDPVKGQSLANDPGQENAI